jgi:hypothetical protein
VTLVLQDDIPFPPVLCRATEWIFDHTVAIYFQMPNGNPVPWGTGVLLRIADASFVLSASHVLERASEATLRIAACVEGSRFVTVSSLDVRRSEDTDHLDVGVVRLNSDDAQRLSMYKKFLRLADVDTAQCMPAGAYLVTGFPSKLTKIDLALNEITANRFSYLTYLAAVEGETPGMTLGLEFRSSVLRHVDGTDVKRMPELKGISGCGIWRLWTEDQTASLDRWDPSWIRLSGIEHAVTARRSIRGTIIGHAIGIIARSYPELVPSIRLSLR